MALTDAQRNSNIDIRYYEQDAYGETPSSESMTALRVTKEMFKVNKKTVASKILGTRQQEALYKVGEDFTGGFGAELAFGEFDPFFEGLLGADFVAVTVTATDISFAQSDSSINSAGAGFGSILAGMWLLISGTASHNGLWYVASKSSASKLILSRGVSAAGATLTVADESAGASMTVKANQLRQGDTLKSYTFERVNGDNDTFDVWNGWVVGQCKIDMRADDLVQIEFSGPGKVADLNNGATIAGSVAAASTNAAINTTNNLMRVYDGTTVLTDELVSASITIDNTAANRTSLGNATPTGAKQNTLRVTGTEEFYFLTNARRQAMQDHTAKAQYFIFKDPSASKFLILTITNLYYTDLSNMAEDADGDTLEKYSIDATKDGTYSQTITIDSLS
jgi:hypothetical protein